MAVLYKDPNATKEKKNHFQECFEQGTLAAVKPAAESKTIFRPIPEIGPDGNIIPMIKSMTVAGPDYSNITIEQVIINAGVSTKFSGLCGASDSDATEAINMVFSSIYIKLKAKEKRGELPIELADKIKKMLEEVPLPSNPKIKNRIIQRPQELGFMQGVALTVNGKTLDRPAIRQALVLPSTLIKGLNALLTQAHKDGKDIFDPKTGYALAIKGVAPGTYPGQQTWAFTVELDKQIPLPDAKVKELWVPWKSAFKRFTTDQLLTYAIRCYGADIVAVIYPDDVARLHTQAAKPVQQAVQPVQQAKPAQATQPVQTHAGPQELDLSSAIAGPVDDGSGDEGHSEPAASSTTASSPEDLAKDYQKLLKDI